MRKKLVFALLAILLLTPWPVAYAHENDMSNQGAVQITAAEASAAPGWRAFGRAIGGVSAGDLFYVDTTNSPVDMMLTLHITNADELAQSYRYMTLKVGVYVQNGDGQWQRATLGNGGMIPDIYITMQNGYVSFTLPGYAQYKVAIDRGSFYCFGTDGDKGSISPQFYLTVG